LLLETTRICLFLSLLVPHDKNFFLVNIYEGPLWLYTVGIFARKLAVKLSSSFLSEEGSTIKTCRGLSLQISHSCSVASVTSNSSWLNSICHIQTHRI
jgi:hypothetical protein